MSIGENIAAFHKLLENTPCNLVAVSKTKPSELILEAYNAGQRDFGENKVQELSEKSGQLQADVRWHMIGHLQTNKVKHIAPFIHLIHSVDSLKLLEEINKQALKSKRIIDCLLQVHIAQEEHKFGFDALELEGLFTDKSVATLENVRIIGLMGMATFTEDTEQIRREFKYLHVLFEKIKRLDLPENVQMREISMGMSDDFQIAIEEGSTLIRVGSKIFGPRIYL
ncbi:MAG: YggS family pyridoxal phosphate-dependent enzyme [Cyclobacteriaceae bacterium]|nr:YggS family pyridoxal phosphate-dependent enzyme [Cyclobacteriaceae bacterium]